MPRSSWLGCPSRSENVDGKRGKNSFRRGLIFSLVVIHCHAQTFDNVDSGRKRVYRLGIIITTYGTIVGISGHSIGNNGHIV